MRFVLFLEGHSEKIVVPAFVRQWLNGRLQQQVGVKPVNFNGWPNLVREAPKKAEMYLTRYSDVIGVVGLMDLYGPDFYPEEKATASERVTWAKEYLEKKVGQPQFRMFFAVHELEAWLLSDPRIFPTEVRLALSSMARIPEAVNFGEPPAKLLARLYWEKTHRTYKKVVHGKSLFARLDPNVAYEKCPELKRMLDEMLRMARDAKP